MKTKYNSMKRKFGRNVKVPWILKRNQWDLVERQALNTTRCFTDRNMNDSDLALLALQQRRRSMQTDTGNPILKTRASPEEHTKRKFK